MHSQGQWWQLLQQVLVLQLGVAAEEQWFGLRRKCTSTFNQLYQGMLHPDAARRITAAQMLALLQSPVPHSLKNSPFCIGAPWTWYSSTSFEYD